MLADINLSEIQTESKDKESDGQLDGGLGQDVARFGSEGGLRHAATEGGTHATILRLLRENDQDEERRYEKESESEDAKQNANHEKL